MSPQASRPASIVLVVVLALLGVTGLATRGGLTVFSAAAPNQAPEAQGTGVPASGITVEWLGWSHYRLTSPSGKVVLTNPRVERNPDVPITLEEAIARGGDLIVVADAHSDELGNTIEIAQASGARVVTPAFEMGTWLAEMGVPRPQLSFTSPGEVDRHEGITVRVVKSVHGSAPARASESVYYGGPAAGFMITFENGFTVYFSGSSAATLDMGMWAEMYKPDLAIVYAGARHEPLDAAMVVKLMATNNPNLRTVLPHHHVTRTPPGAQGPADLRAALGQAGVNVNFVEPDPGRPFSLSK